MISKHTNFHLCYTDCCSKWAPSFCKSSSLFCKRESVAFLKISLLLP